MKALGFVFGLGTEFSLAVLSTFSIARVRAGGTALLRSPTESHCHHLPPLKLFLPHSFNGTAPCSQGPAGKKSHDNAALKQHLQSWPISLLRWECSAVPGLPQRHSCSFTVTPPYCPLLYTTILPSPHTAFTSSPCNSFFSLLLWHPLTPPILTAVPVLHGAKPQLFASTCLLAGTVAALVFTDQIAQLLPHTNLITPPCSLVPFIRLNRCLSQSPRFPHHALMNYLN